jgi:3-deoxy-D-manno-octulosonic-acid transferase
MYLLYSLLLSLAFIVLLPWFVWQAFSNKKYLHNFRERLGLLPEGFCENKRPTIWLHAVSVGESLAARSLLAALRTRFPEHRLIVSTTTATGQAVARSRLPEADGFCYFPFDWNFSVSRALDRLRPQAVILMESELWPNFLRECEMRRIPVIVANGRISDRSFARSQKFSFLLRRLYSQVSHFAMQSQTDADRALTLGAQPDGVSVSGNIKYDVGEHDDPGSHLTYELDQAFSLTRSPLIVAGSTTDGEEEMVLAAFEKLRRQSQCDTVRLLMAPRHPERFDEVVRLLNASRLRVIRRSDWQAEPASAIASASNTASAIKAEIPSEINWAITPHDEFRRADVILLDSIGELARLYRFASVVFIGGSLVARGGHNILEPALYGRPIIVGPHMENFREIAAEFTKREALLTVQGSHEAELTENLCEAFHQLLTDEKCADKLGENARQVVNDNRGATARTVEIIARIVQEVPRSIFYVY